MGEIIAAKKFPVKFCLGLEVAGFRLLSGETRITIESALTVLGHGELLQSDPVTALQNLGYRCREDIASVFDTGSGSTFETISLFEFKGLIFFSARKGGIQANAFVESLVSVALEDWCRECFREHLKSR